MKKKKKKRNAAFQWIIDHVRPSVSLTDDADLNDFKDSETLDDYKDDIKNNLKFKISFKWKF